jgi:hypothetical protein
MQLLTLVLRRRDSMLGEMYWGRLVLLLEGLGQIVQQARDGGALTRLALRVKVEECARNKNGM